MSDWNSVQLECFRMVSAFFDDDTAKTNLWFDTPNPMLGNIKPREMLTNGKELRLRNWILESLSMNVQMTTERERE